MAHQDIHQHLPPTAATTDVTCAGPDSLCRCAHRESSHADASSGDTRCLVIEDRRDLITPFDDGREHDHAYGACLRFTAS